MVKKIILLMVLIGCKIYPSDSAQQMQWTDTGLQNIPARPVNQTTSVDVFANALFWRTTEDIDWALVLVPKGNAETINFKTISFDWSPGFRVGVGYSMEHDQWDTQFTYTWFHTQTTDHIDSGSGEVSSVFAGTKVSLITLIEYYDTGKISWKLNFNMLDWDLGRCFYVSDSLAFRPSIGVKGGWINQTIHTEWETFDFLDLGFDLASNENLKNDFSGVGPKGAVNGKWILGNICNHCFSVFGDFAAAYMWGHWKFRDKFHDNLATTVTAMQGNRNFGSMMLQGMVGIGWDFSFFNDPSHFAMKLGYEIQDWFNQYQQFDNSSGLHNNDLILQGLTLDLRFDY